MKRPLLQCFPDHIELDAAVSPVFGDFDIGRRRSFVERSKLGEGEFSSIEIDGLAIVGVDQAKIPEVGTLIEIGNSGRGGFQKRLRQPISHSEESNSFVKLGGVS